eukprot:54423-Amphidinium_carterae.3
MDVDGVDFAELYSSMRFRHAAIHPEGEWGVMGPALKSSQLVDLHTKAAAPRVRKMACHAIGLELKSGQAQTQKQALV